MVVAVVSVGVVEMVVDQVIDVVAVRDGGVAAVGPVGVPRLVGGASVIRGAVIGVARANRERVLIDVVSVGMVEMTVVQVVDVVVVPDREMPASRTVLVLVPSVDLVVSHRPSVVVSRRP